jgi:hypothetical protein
MRDGFHSLPADLESSDRLFSRHRRELMEKLIQRVACLQIVEQVSDRHTGPYEHGLTAHDLGIAVNYVLGHPLQFSISLTAGKHLNYEPERDSRSQGKQTTGKMLAPRCQAK